MDNFLAQAVEELCNRHHCHTVILYGSRARGDFTPESDYDLLGIRDSGGKIRDARWVDNHYLDAFVYPEKDIVGKPTEFLRILDGKVLVETRSLGAQLLAEVKACYELGPKLIPPDEEQTLRAWIPKMLARAEREDTEGHYRRHWLLFQLLEDYFALRGQWYLGPKLALQHLHTHEPAIYSAYQSALHPAASLQDLKNLAACVLNAPPLPQRK
jgi:predicted nucleotidyltransferase